MSAAPGLGQPLPFRFLLDESVRHARRHFRQIYPAVAVPLALAAGTMPLLQGRLLWGAGRPAPTPEDMLGIGGFFVGIFAFLVFYGLGYAALLTAAVDALAGRGVSMARAWRFVLRPKVLGTLVLTALAVGAGSFCCLLPGLYVALLFGLIVPVLVEEDRFGTGAMGRSAELMRYNPQRQLDADPRVKLFVVFFVGALLGYVMNLAVQLPFIVFQQVVVFRDIASGQRPDSVAMMQRLMWFQVPSQILGMLVNTAVHLYVSFGFALLFFDIRWRKEGLDLEAAIERLALSRSGAP